MRGKRTCRKCKSTNLNGSLTFTESGTPRIPLYCKDCGAYYGTVDGE